MNEIGGRGEGLDGELSEILSEFDLCEEAFGQEVQGLHEERTDLGDTHSHPGNSVLSSCSTQLLAREVCG